MNSSPTEITLIRHGETAWNAENRMQGHLDISLNATGLAQAAALGARFKNESIQVIYSSDLSRAYSTAEAIAKTIDNGVKLAIQCDPRLRERHMGVLQGLTPDEAKSTRRSEWDTLKSRHPEAPLEGGESLRVFFQRIAGFLTEVCERHAGENILLVTHGGVMDAAYRHATGMPLEHPRDFSLFNASINVLTHHNREWRVKSWGDVAHLNLMSLDDAAIATQPKSLKYF